MKLHLATMAAALAATPALAAAQPLASIRTSPEELALRVPAAAWRAPLESEGRNAPSTLPTLAISVDSDDFFSPSRGIYVPGNAYVRGGYGSNKWGKPNANYFEKGSRPAKVSLTEPNGDVSAWSAPVEIEMHGGATRALPQKSLELHLDKHAPYVGSFFPGQGVRSYRGFLVRNGGNDWYGPSTAGVATMLKDAFFHRLAAPLRIGTMAYRPCVVTINGEYWGIHNIRELIDRHYFETRYGVNAKTVDALSQKEGDKRGLTCRIERQLGAKSAVRDYEKALERVEAAGAAMTLAAAEREFDLESYTDYMIAEMFFANTDWPQNNVLMWRTCRRGAGDFADGRWRWVLYDLDLAGTSVHGVGGETIDMFAYLARGDVRSRAHPAWLFNRLWTCAEYRRRFAERATELLAGPFSSERTATLLKDSMAAIAPEIERHYRRWGREFSECDWRKAVDSSIVKLLAARRECFMRHLAEARRKAGDRLD